MTTQKLDFEIHDIDSGVASLHKYCYWLQDKLKQLCQAVDGINQQVQINEMHIRHHMDFLNSMNERIEKIKSTFSDPSGNMLKMKEHIESFRPFGCNHDFDTTMILTSNPPHIKCKSCGFTKVFGSTPDVFTKNETKWDKQ